MHVEVGRTPDATPIAKIKIASFNEAVSVLIALSERPDYVHLWCEFKSDFNEQDILDEFLHRKGIKKTWIQ